MTVLLDDGDHKEPTHANITEAFKALSEKSKPGDAVFIHFSGHGSRVLAQPQDAEAGYDEVISPTDYHKKGLIRDTLIFKTLLAPMKYGVTVTMLIDTCDTGMMLELPYVWSTGSDRASSSPIPSMVHNDNFSYVRFLKVVKTLYESSAFTQLGRAVGTVLSNCKSDEEGDNTVTDDTCDTRDMVADDENSRIEGQQSTRGFMDFFTLCTRPPEEVTCSDGRVLRTSCHELVESETMDSCGDAQPRPGTFMDQVVSFIRGEDFSDDESLPTDDEGMQGYDSLREDTTYESTTDQDYETSKKAKRSKAKKRGRNRRRRR